MQLTGLDFADEGLPPLLYAADLPSGPRRHQGTGHRGKGDGRQAVGDAVGGDLGGGGRREGLAVAAIVADVRASPLRAGGGEGLDEPVEERADDVADIVALADLGDDRRQLQGRQGLGVEVTVGHRILLSQGGEPRLDRLQPGCVGDDRRAQLVGPGLQQRPPLASVQLVVEDPADLFEGEPEILQRDEPVGPLQLVRGIAAVAGERIHPRRREQPEPVVVPQHAHRHPGQSRELSDTQHGAAHETP